MEIITKMRKQIQEPLNRRNHVIFPRPTLAKQTSDTSEKGAPVSGRYGKGYLLLVVVAAALPSPVEETTDAIVPQCVCH